TPPPANQSSDARLSAPFARSHRDTDSLPQHQTPPAFLSRQRPSATHPARENSAHPAPAFPFPELAMGPSHPHPVKRRCSRSPASASAPTPRPSRESAPTSQSNCESSARFRSLPDRSPARAFPPAQSSSRVAVAPPGLPTTHDPDSPALRSMYPGVHRNAP